MRKTTTVLVAFVAVAILGPGTAGRADIVPVCSNSPVQFGAPVTLTPQDRGGYEPGIEIDSAGTIFVTAHKLMVTNEGTRLQSWLWRSTDNGATFSDVVGLNGLSTELYGDEGDLAIDAKDRMYFVDTTVTDDQFYRFSNHGATLDIWRPAVPSAEPVDDRPWIAAHHDGDAYYMSNTGWTPNGRLTVHRSTDGGQSFDPVGYNFPNSGWGYIEADPNSDYVYAFMDDLFYGTGLLGDATKTLVYVSSDLGQTWAEHDVAPYETGDNGDGFPAVAVSPVDGAVYGIWLDGTDKVKLARSTDHGSTWTTYDITPFAGRYGYPWVAVSPTGEVGVIFAADPKAATAGPGAFVYGMIWRPSGNCLTNPLDPASICTAPSERYARLQSANVGTVVTGQADFFQDKFSPDGALNVPYTDDSTPTDPIKFVRETAGPNLDGSAFCGVVGTP